MPIIYTFNQRAGSYNLQRKILKTSQNCIVQLPQGIKLIVFKHLQILPVLSCNSNQLESRKIRDKIKRKVHDMASMKIAKCLK